MLSEIAELKGRSPVQRLGLFLLAQLRAAEMDEADEATLTLSMSKVQLASRIGITPESLSRALARLRPLGVSSSGRDFTVSSPVKLREFCGAD